MKKITWILLLCLGSVFSSLQAQMIGQGLTPEERTRTQELILKSRLPFKESGVQSLKLEKQVFKNGKAKGDYYTVMVSRFDAEGMAQRRESYKRDGKLWRIAAYTYTPDQMYSSIKEVKANGKPVYSTEQTFENALVKSITYRFGTQLNRGQLTSFTYDPEGKVTQTVTSGLRKPGNFYTSKFSYHEDGSKKRMEQFNSKGRLLSVTDYACDPVGKTIGAAHVEERQVCERREQDANGHLITVTETFIGGKSNFRQVSKTDEAGHLLEISNFNQAGVATYSQKNEFDEKGHVTQTEEFSMGKSVKRIVYEFDERGNTSQQTNYNKKGQMTSRSRFTYTYFN